MWPYTGKRTLTAFRFQAAWAPVRLKHQPAVRTASSPVRWKHQTVRTTLTPVRWRHQAVRTAWSSVLQWHPFELDFRFFLSNDILGDKFYAIRSKNFICSSGHLIQCFSRFVRLYLHKFIGFKLLFCSF